MTIQSLRNAYTDGLYRWRIYRAENRAIRCGTPSNWLKVYDLKAAHKLTLVK